MVAPRAWLSGVHATPRSPPSVPSLAGKVTRRHPERMLWSELVLRVFLEDALRCPCGGKRKVLAMIFDPVSIERVLKHLGLPYGFRSRAPPRPMQVGLAFSG